MTEVLSAERVAKTFDDGERSLNVLSSVDLSVAEGERIALLGRSGSGKSTLLHILAGLTDLDEGEVTVAGESMSSASPSTRARLRNQFMGFVYQFHHLLPEFSAIENVAMPLWIRGGSEAKTATATASEILDSVGLGDRQDHMPHQLSGGEKQRVAICRAMVTNPALVLGDEITGNLDTENADGVLNLIEEMRSSSNTAFVVVTHDSAVAKRMDRTFWLENGILRPHAD